MTDVLVLMVRLAQVLNRAVHHWIDGVVGLVGALCGRCRRAGPHA